jgi:hypothetical protein
MKREESEFKRFKNFVQNIISVSKSEIDWREAEYKSLAPSLKELAYDLRRFPPRCRH